MKMNYTNPMHQWFKYLFSVKCNEQGYINCFECGKPLRIDIYGDNTCCYSHILSKAKYPEYAGEQWNVEIVCPDCHNLYEMKPKQAVNQYKRKQELLEKITNE